METKSDTEDAPTVPLIPELPEPGTNWPTEALWRWEHEDYEMYLRTCNKDEAAIRDLATQKLRDPLIPLFSKLKLRLLLVIHLDHGVADEFKQQKQDVRKTRQIIEQIERVPSPIREPHHSSMLGRARKFLDLFVEASTANREKAMAEDREVEQEEIDQVKEEWRQSVREAFGTSDRDRENDVWEAKWFFMVDV